METFRLLHTLLVRGEGRAGGPDTLCWTGTEPAGRGVQEEG